MLAALLVTHDPAHEVHMRPDAVHVQVRAAVV
jgi:hypothetical protein